MKKKRLPSWVKDLLEHLDKSVDKAVDKRVNGKIDGLHLKLDAHITAFDKYVEDDMKWKGEAQTYRKEKLEPIV